MDDPLLLPAVFGENLKRLRKDHQLTLDDVSKASRAYGVKWTAQRIAGMEAGKASVTVPTVCIAAWALTDLTDFEFTPAQLLASDEPIQLNDAFTVNGTVIADAIEGRLPELDGHHFPDSDARVREAIEGATANAEAWGGELTVKDVTTLSARVGLADQRAADRLGIDVRTLCGEAYRRWGMLLSEAVEQQAGPHASPQRKGHITRRLEAQLREVIDRGDD